jgi:prepilin-type N-terminal cleavage/methylation domain-containing protein
MLIYINKRAGFTLIEMLISLLLGSFLLAMIIGLYVNNVSASVKALKFSRLRTDLQALSALIENDLRRAGYGGSDFMVGATKAKVVDVINNDTQQCIVYAYNYDDASLFTSSHVMAFRYSIINQSVQFGRKVDKQAINCFSSGFWVNLSDPNFLKVTQLNFVETSASNDQLILRSVDITIAGELVGSPTFKHQIQTQIQIRNPEFY